ncbi:hypothetical protein AX17_005039, partial [Amanita inopinata Kibby_2008]
ATKNDVNEMIATPITQDIDIHQSDLLFNNDGNDEDVNVFTEGDTIRTDGNIGFAEMHTENEADLEDWGLNDEDGGEDDEGGIIEDDDLYEVEPDGTAANIATEFTQSSDDAVLISAASTIFAGHQSHSILEHDAFIERLSSSKAAYKKARWAKLRGPGSTAVSELFGIDGIQDALGLSYKNSRELNKIIDSKLPSLPHFQEKDVTLGEKRFTVYFRDPLKCIEALFGNPDISSELLLVPERQFSDRTRKEQWFHEMNTGLWWWETQKAIEKNKPGATIAPVILSSDKTQVTTFRSKQAYPVYLTIGNIPKNIRRKPSHRTHVLVAYLPTTKLEHIKNIASRRRTLANLFHACMSQILKPLRKAGREGMPMTSGDGILRRVHPIVAVYACDYPEQLLVTCIKTGECPKCLVTNKELGDPKVGLAFRDLEKILNVLSLADEDPVHSITVVMKIASSLSFIPSGKNSPMLISTSR